MPETKLTKAEIHSAIRRGELDFLVDSIASGIIEVPKDLVGFEKGDTILHIAARYGQVKVLAHFAEFIDSSIKNNRGVITEGYTAEEVAASYGNHAKKGPAKNSVGLSVSFEDRDKAVKAYKNALPRGKGIFGTSIFSELSDVAEEDSSIRKILSRPEEDPRPYMAQIFGIAKMPAGPDRDAEFANLKKSIPDKVLPSRGENLNISSGTSGVYTSLKGPDGTNLDSAALYLAVSERIADERKKINEEKAERNDIKNGFLFKAAQGSLTEEDVVNYLEGRREGKKKGDKDEYYTCGGGGLTDATSRKDETGLKDAEHSGSNALHHAIRNGHIETAKMLLEGIEVQGEIFAIDFDERARDILKECLEKKPSDPEYQKFKTYLEGPVITTKLRPPEPSPTHPQVPALNLGAVGKEAAVGGRGP